MSTTEVQPPAKRRRRKRAPKAKPGEVVVYYGYAEGEGPDLCMNWHSPAARGDGYWLFDLLGGGKFIEELRRRGYDPDTLKLTVSRKAGAAPA